MENHSKKMRNKIVLVPFPFDNFSTTKVRTCVCLTDSVGKSEHVVAFISSKHHQAQSNTDIIIENSQEGFEQTGLMLS